jgi:hypothetical protein
MLVVVGAIGLGLVYGWVSARLLRRARWDVAARVLLGLSVLGLLVFHLAATRAVMAFGVAVLAGALACSTWLRALERRYGA